MFRLWGFSVVRSTTHGSRRSGETSVTLLRAAKVMQGISQSRTSQETPTPSHKAGDNSPKPLSGAKTRPRPSKKLAQQTAQPDPHPSNPFKNDGHPDAKIDFHKPRWPPPRKKSEGQISGSTIPETNSPPGPNQLPAPKNDFQRANPDFARKN